MTSITANNRMEVARCLKNYQEAGLIKHDALLSIPFSNRIPALVKSEGEKNIHAIVVVMLTEFCNYFNVIRPMNNQQIVECAYEILISSEEDQLSIEDLALFFQGAKQGKYGKVYDRLDLPMIFEMMEVYREERHRQYKRLKEEKETQYKAGSGIRTSDGEKELKDLFHSANLQQFKEKYSGNE